MACLEGSWGGGLDCGSNPLKPSPSRFFGYFLIGIRKYRPRQGEFDATSFFVNKPPRRVNRLGGFHYSS